MLSFAVLYWGSLLPLACQSFSLKAPPSPPTSILHRVDRFLDKVQQPEAQLKNHTYLTGNYAPVEHECTQLPIEVIEGSLPTDLDGLYVRNGPNPTAFRNKRYHWFDGHAMLHLLRIKDGQAVYSNQYVPCVRYEKERELGEEFFPHLAEYDGLLGLFKILYHPNMVRQLVSDLKTVAPPNTSCVMYENQFYCLHEANLPFQAKINRDLTLSPVGFQDFDGQLDYPVSAHPRIDPTNGDLLFHSYTTDQEMIERDGPIKFGRLRDGKLQSYFAPSDYADEYVSFAHNMLHTERFVVLYDTSVHFETKALFEGGSFFQTSEEHNLRFAIFDKLTATSMDDVTWFDTGAPGGIVHPLNAWEEEEEGNEVVIWTPLCENLVLDFDADEKNRFDMVEFRLNLKTGQVQKTVIDQSVNVEFSVVPTMGKKTRYGYTAIQDPGVPGEGCFTGFCIWDMHEKGPPKCVYYPKNEVGGEPVVIADGSSSYVGVYTYHLVDGTSCFLLYDEQGKMVTRMKMPSRVPFGFHGTWVPGADLEAHWNHHDGDKEVR